MSAFDRLIWLICRIHWIIPWKLQTRTRTISKITQGLNHINISNLAHLRPVKPHYIWRHESWPMSVTKMDSYLKTRSHPLNQCWLIAIWNIKKKHHGNTANCNSGRCISKCLQFFYVLNDGSRNIPATYNIRMSALLVYCIHYWFVGPLYIMHCVGTFNAWTIFWCTDIIFSFIWSLPYKVSAQFANQCCSVMPWLILMVRQIYRQYRHPQNRWLNCYILD